MRLFNIIYVMMAELFGGNRFNIVQGRKLLEEFLEKTARALDSEEMERERRYLDQVLGRPVQQQRVAMPLRRRPTPAQTSGVLNVMRMGGPAKLRDA